ncbi:hypothetical protein AAFN85_27225 [Mucilaginibacter sp. CAU 1740]|uniref:hypothetical protein n=1 Tax=Mucilaginibacter sp. CAU 1740 TaxID=3140365 RepID=UPI00325B7600
MNIRQEQLRSWVSGKYAGRLTPLSGEPYFHHVLTVAELAGKYADLGYETGLCHDMLEDGICTDTELQAVLQGLHYTEKEISLIRRTVIELTDVFTAEAYPELSKKKRRQKEANRLERICPLAQTVKYADMVYNIGWVIRYQQRKVRRYLKRKLKLLKQLDKGDATMRQLALKTARHALKIYADS